MADGIKVMSELTGLSRETVLDIAAGVRANIAKLSACSLHTFEPIAPAQPLRTRYRCTSCGGEIDSSAYRWYQLGRAHAGDQ